MTSRSAHPQCLSTKPVRYTSVDTATRRSTAFQDDARWDRGSSTPPSRSPSAIARTADRIGVKAQASDGLGIQEVRNYRLISPNGAVRRLQVPGRSSRRRRDRSCCGLAGLRASVQAVPAREAEAARTILPHPFFGRYTSPEPTSRRCHLSPDKCPRTVGELRRPARHRCGSGR